MRKSRTFLNFTIFLLSFLATLIILSIRWIRKTFGSNVEIEQILFNLQTPIITQTDPIFYQSFILKALLPALLIACIIALLNNASCIKWFKILCSFLARHIIALKATLCAGLCVTSLIYAYQKLGIKDFLANNSQDKIYSNFYEEHYIAPPLQEIAHQFSALESKRNVIVIFVESLESTFSSQNIPMGGGSIKAMQAILEFMRLLANLYQI